MINFTFENLSNKSNLNYFSVFTSIKVYIFINTLFPYFLVLYLCFYWANSGTLETYKNRDVEKKKNWILWMEFGTS